ncbi:RidA family protein [Leisingera sp. ANG-Vp]|uniref:RidA family protein n=1 Tax=Leisingera sp. ANG-Vp TaxID=1577896 RepID=UPI00057CC95B|nr:RidA family protein [Leisingera sp. ANG-Vp]KIC21565.1 hypothetical protein RA20_04310 [Leisingera sp. ANG-Vp]
MTSIIRLAAGPRMSQAVLYGDLIWLAGQCGSANTSVSDQTREALAKVDHWLTESGSGRDRILNTTIYLSDIAAYDEMNAVWDAWIPPGCTPARACVEARLGGSGYDVEIVCVAAKGQGEANG